MSCGRWSGRHVRVCPYCGEQVWHPRWWRAGQWGMILLPPALLAGLAFLTRPDWGAFARMARTTHPAVGFLFAAGLGLLLLPVPDRDLVASSRSELCRWQVRAMIGGWLMAGYAGAGTFCVRCGHPGGWACLLAVGIGLCVASAPFFFRIPWRSLVAVALLAAMIAESIREYAG